MEPIFGRITGLFNADDLKAAHVLSVFAQDQAMSLGYLATDDKSNEVPAAQTLIKNLGLEGRLFIADAMHCQKNLRSGVPDRQSPFGPIED
ncbi:MAG: hypothetical protein ACR2RF_24215 [Geminicoccaceae bacterium]